MWMTDQECRTSVCRGETTVAHLVPNPFPLAALHQTLACNVGGHTHTPELLAIVKAKKSGFTMSQLKNHA